MAWTAVDRAIKTVELDGADGCEGPLDRWRELRDSIHDEVCRLGYDAAAARSCSITAAQDVDASLLMIPLVGFLPASDPRVRGTVEAVQRELMHDGLVLRYPTHPHVDGLPEGEGAFLACTFWLADCLALLGRRDEAADIFRRLLDLRNDVGLLSEEYDPATRRFLREFPAGVFARRLDQHGMEVDAVMRTTTGHKRTARCCGGQPRNQQQKSAESEASR